MLKEHISFFRKVEVILDLVLAIAAFYLSYPFGQAVSLLGLFLSVWIIMLFYLGMYESFRIRKMHDVLLIIWASAFIGTGICASAAYIFKIQELSRIFVVFIFFGAAALTSIEKIALMIFLRHIRKRGYNFHNILVVGTGPKAQRFIDLARRRSEWGLKIIGFIDQDKSLVGEEIKGFKVIGTVDDIVDIVHENVVDEIVFIVPSSWLSEIEKVVFFCETEGIRTHVAIDMFNLQFAKAKQTELEGFLLLTFERTSIKVWQLFLKGIFDVVFSAVLLILLLPLFIVVSVLIKATSKGPVFYKQTRCGLNGRKFTLYKFRTMFENADKLLDSLAKNNEMNGPVFKMKDDPRITPLGKFLRKSSIDELPQLWNVLKRDMSIIGPRPPIPAEVKEYDNWQRRRLSMRPGITCIWQVKGRNIITDFNEWVRLDLEYIDHWSMFGDLKILLQTVPAVFFGVGAK